MFGNQTPGVETGRKDSTPGLLLQQKKMASSEEALGMPGPWLILTQLLHPATLSLSR